MAKKFDVCEHCCTWCGEMDGKSPLTVYDTYPKMVKKVLKHRFGMSKDAAEMFICGACVGNWDRLHLTSAEKSLTSSQFADMLVGDVFYCSDRFSYDRLLRIQWMYQQLGESLRREEAMV